LLLLLLDDLLPELELRLLPLALGLLRLELELLLLLPPLDADPRLLPELLRDEEEPDLDEEEELRDAIACSLGRLIPGPPLLPAVRPQGQSRQAFRAGCRFSQPLRVGIALPSGPHA
jgi:hypothetical protein